jgi:catechol 2,3-dioxygenase-like lactoylglutathione lyase family enzyme
VLTDRAVYSTVPAADLTRAKNWYREKLGLTPASESDVGAMYRLGAGGSFLLYPSQFGATAKNTAMEFTSTNVAADVATLRTRGVVFEEYDFPGLKTEDGVAQLGLSKAAWFKDSEGNLLALGDATN